MLENIFFCCIFCLLISKCEALTIDTSFYHITNYYLHFPRISRNWKMLVPPVPYGSPTQPPRRERLTAVAEASSDQPEVRRTDPRSAPFTCLSSAPQPARSPSSYRPKQWINDWRFLLFWPRPPSCRPSTTTTTTSSTGWVSWFWFSSRAIFRKRVKVQRTSATRRRAQKPTLPDRWSFVFLLLCVCARGRSARYWYKASWFLSALFERLIVARWTGIFL